jgi:hypothetical protein
MRPSLLVFRLCVVASLAMFSALASISCTSDDVPKGTDTTPPGLDAQPDIAVLEAGRDVRVEDVALDASEDHPRQDAGDGPIDAAQGSRADQALPDGCADASDACGCGCGSDPSYRDCFCSKLPGGECKMRFDPAGPWDCNPGTHWNVVHYFDGCGMLSVERMTTTGSFATYFDVATAREVGSASGSDTGGTCSGQVARCAETRCDLVCVTGTPSGILAPPPKCTAIDGG